MDEKEIKLEKYETVLLSQINFQDQLRQENGLIGVEIDVENNCMVFNGRAEEISNAKFKVLEKVREIKDIVIEVHADQRGKVAFMQMNRVKSIVNRALNDSGVTATWSIRDGDKIVIHAFSDEDIGNAIQILRKSVYRTVIPVTEPQTRVLKTKAWENLVLKEQETTDETKVIKLMVFEDKLELYCTHNSDIGAKCKIIEDFLQTNEFKECQIVLSAAEIRFLRKHYQDKLQNLKGHFHDYDLRSKINEDGILLTGAAAAVNTAEKFFDAYKNKIVCKTFSLKRPAIVQHLASEEGKDKISQVESQHDVVIDIEEEIEVGEPAEMMNSYKEIAVFTAAKGQKITVTEGDIVNIKADVLVKETDRKLDHGLGALSRTFVKKGGTIIENQRSDYMKESGRHSLSEGEVVCTDAGNLPFSMIAHLIGFSDDNHDRSYLSRGIEDALMQTHSQGYKSIAIPAVGTRMNGLRVEVSCLAIVEAVKDYLNSNSITSIQQVYLCDKNEPTVKEFQAALEKKKFKRLKTTFERTKKPENQQQLTGQGIVVGGSNDIPTATSCQLKIHVVHGQMANQKVDAIVNSTSRELQLTRGAVSKSLLDAGGGILQKECTNRYPGGISPGKVAITSGGKLQCQKVFHGALDNWSAQNSSQKLEAIMTYCLDQATKLCFKSIAFPLFGTGQLGYPKEKVAKLMFRCVEDFERMNPQTSLVDVRFVGNAIDVLEAFKKEEHKRKFPGQSHTASPISRLADKVGLGGSMASKDIQAHSCPIKTTVIGGDIATETVDVIVNSTSKELQLTNGAVSQSLLDAGGEIIQNECTKLYPKGLSSGKVAITRGGKLKCQKVFHGALGQCTGPNILQELETFMTNCLMKASKLGFKSIAFPALGTGILKYPAKDVARLMFSCVETFGTMNPQTTLIDVRFVIFNLPVLHVFQKEDPSRKFQNQGQLPKPSRPSKMFDQSNNTAVDVDNQPEVSMAFDHATFKVYKDDICNANVGVIVNCTDVNFTRKQGRTSAIIFQNGGDNLIRELKVHGNRIKKDKITITTADKGFVCESIIHLDVEDTSSDLKTKIKLVISKMDEIGQKSVAFPIDDMGNATMIGSSFVEVLQAYTGEDIEVHGIVKDDIQLTELKDELETYLSKKPSLASRFAGWSILGKQQRKPQLYVSNFKHLSKHAVTVCGESKQSIHKAINALQKSLETAFKTETVEDMLIKTLPQKDIDELEQQLMNYPVEFEINRSNGTIALTGLPENLLPTVKAIHTQLRHAADMRHLQEHANLISEMVQWVYIEVKQDGEELVDYPPDVNAIIEKAFRESKTKADFRDTDGNVYIVDFNSYTEYPEDNPSDFVKVIRKDKVKASNFKLPSSWQPMNDKENIKLVTLKETDHEYVMVSTEFSKTVSQRTIKKIEKIQNKALYQQYVAKKQSMGSGKDIERTLWHGTKYEALDSINTYGFNRSYCGQNAVLYGNGVYFARDASYSARETYSPKDHNQQKHVYLCTVLTGEFTNGKEGLKVPPTKPGGGHLLYDSVVDNVNNPGIFVIFNDTQAYPEYLILFE